MLMSCPHDNGNTCALSFRAPAARTSGLGRYCACGVQLVRLLCAETMSASQSTCMTNSLTITSLTQGGEGCRHRSAGVARRTSSPGKRRRAGRGPVQGQGVLRGGPTAAR